MQETPAYPLMFTFRDTIYGNGYLAKVTLSGRALTVRDYGEWWMYGVCPSGMAANGDTPQSAFSLFRERYEQVLFDFALDADGFSDFHDHVNEFFHENPRDPEDVERWDTSFHLIREGRMKPKDPFSTLPQERPETRPPKVEVARMDQAGDLLASNNATTSPRPLVAA